jgi:flagellar biosynthesis GTPase FlhF
MDNNAILKLSNKKIASPKKKFTTNVRIEQTQLVDSMTQRMMNAEPQEEQPSSLIQQSLSNSNVKSKSNMSPSNKSASNKAPSEKEPIEKEPTEKAPSENAPSEKAPSEEVPSNKSPSNKSQSKIEMPNESALSQSKVNEMICYNNYGDPVVPDELMNNPEIPDIDMIGEVGFSAMDLDCPYCNTHIQSKVDSTCNCCTVIIFSTFIILPLILLLACLRGGRGGRRSCIFCRDDDDDGCCNCCNDVKHICPKCGKVIRESNACSRLFSCAD